MRQARLHLRIGRREEVDGLTHPGEIAQVCRVLKAVLGPRRRSLILSQLARSFYLTMAARMAARKAKPREPSLATLSVGEVGGGARNGRNRRFTVILHMKMFWPFSVKSPCMMVVSAVNKSEKAGGGELAREGGGDWRGGREGGGGVGGGGDGIIQ